MKSFNQMSPSNNPNFFENKLIKKHNFTHSINVKIEIEMKCN